MPTTQRHFTTDATISDTGAQLDAYQTSGASPPLSDWCWSQLTLPPEVNADIFSPDDPDPLARALERAKASAGAAAMAVVDCTFEGENPLECPVARSLIAAAASDLEWLEELVQRDQFDADRALDDGFPAETES
jgi:hypothetical protein